MKEPLLAVKAPVSNHELNELHAAAFGHELVAVPWVERLTRHSLFWVTARWQGSLIGFVNVIGDGGAHAVLLDICVHPHAQGEGIGQALVRSAADEAERLGCRWRHADYEPDIVDFYERMSGLSHTEAGLLRLGSG